MSISLTLAFENMSGDVCETGCPGLRGWLLRPSRVGGVPGFQAPEKVHREEMQAPSQPETDWVANISCFGCREGKAPQGTPSVLEAGVLSEEAVVGDWGE